ncbi:MAG: HlyD family secretion protein [Rhizobiaceae bacterium]
MGVHLILVFVIALRFFQPYSIDAHVIRPVIQIVPRLPEPTLLTSVEIAPNTPVKKGEPFYRFDKEIYEMRVREQEAALASAQQNVKILERDVELAEDSLKQAQANRAYAAEQERRYADLAKQGAGRQENYDKWKQQLAAADAQVLEAQVNIRKAELARDAQIDGVKTKVAEAEAKLAQANYYLDQTTIHAPEDGMIISQQARPGLVVGSRRIAAIAAFVADADPYLLATFHQSHLKLVRPGQAVEFALDRYPGQIFDGKVEHVWRATGQGQLLPSGRVPKFLLPELRGRFAVQINVDDANLDEIEAGAHGAAVIYTGQGKGFEFLRRMNVRIYSWANFIFPLNFL